MIAMRKFLSQIVSAIIGLWAAAMFVPGVIIKAYPSSNFFGFPLQAQWEIIIVLGIVLGLLNYFLKPILKTLALPLEIITLGLFTIVIDMGLIWILDQIFDELYIPFLFPLLYTTLIILVINIIAGLIFKNKYE
jgi:putative membrane protein